MKPVYKCVNIELDKCDAEVLYNAEKLLLRIKEVYESKVEVREYDDTHDYIEKAYDELESLNARFNVHIMLGVDR